MACSYLYIFLAGMALTLAGAVILLFRLWRRQERLERQSHHWQQLQQRLQCDLAGLCAAGVQMDTRIRGLASELVKIQSLAREWEHQENEEEPTYQSAIKRIRQGAGVEELVEEWGFSHEEATLLIRLYQSDSASGKGSCPDF